MVQWSVWGLRLGVFLAIALDRVAIAQITPDATLGAESTVVTPINPSRDQIEGGAIRGANLFHSFREFNIGAGREVYFANPAGIENILTRVTGSTRSEILGTLGVSGNANLFLINPNGIVFGSNARLDMRGSFLASTASSFKFADGIEFSATNPQAPPLLTINVPIGLQFGVGAGAIATNVDLNPDPVSFNVEPGRTLALVGGDLRLQGGTILEAPEGRIELGSVGDNSFVSLTPTTGGFALGYEGVQNFRDIQLLGLERGARVSTAGEGGGNIQVQSRRLTLEGGSQIEADTQGAGSGATVTLRATESIDLRGTSPDGFFSSGISATTFGTGNAGNVRIETLRLTIRDGAVVGTTTASAGKAGNVSINATQSVELSGTSSVIFAGSINAGDAGNITIDTGQLIIRGDRASIATLTLGAGKAGNVSINATQSVELSGTASGIAAWSFGTGNAGNVTINTGRLIVRDGASVAALTVSDGNGGTVTVNARESVELIGVGAVSDPQLRSINGQTGSSLGANTLGAGNAGNVTIQTGRLIVRDGAQINAGTLGDGDGGNVTVKARESVELIGTSPDGLIRSQLSATTGDISFQITSGKGNAGNVTIETLRLIVRDGAAVAVATVSNGNAGTVSVNATQSVELIGTSANGQNQSSLAAATLGVGNAGNVTIQTGQLIVRDGAGVIAGTLGDGDAGNITVNAGESVELIGTSADGQNQSSLGATTSEGTGDAGNVTINTPQLIVRDGAAVLAGSFLGRGDGGTIAINAQRLIVQNGGSVVVGTLFSQGDAGTIAIKASELVDLSGIEQPSTLGGATQNGGNAGDVTIETRELIVRDRAEINVNSTRLDFPQEQLTPQQLALSQQRGLTDVLNRDPGDPGSINITTRSVRLDNQGSLNAASQTGNGGNITVRSRNIQLRRQSQFSAAGSPTGVTKEGSININTQSLVLLEASSIITSANDPQGGSNINIQPRNDLGLALFQSPNSIINARGQLNIEGDIQPSNPNIPQIEVVDATNLIADRCAPARRGSSFVVTRRGGIPAIPEAPLGGENVLVDLVSMDTGEQVSRGAGEQVSKMPNSNNEIIEATGWIINEQGQVVLVAAHTAPGYNPEIKPINCHVR